MHNVVNLLYYTAGSCIFNDDLDSILYVPLLIVYSVGSGVVSPKLCNFGNLKLVWRLHQSQNTIKIAVFAFISQSGITPLLRSFCACGDFCGRAGGIHPLLRH